MEHWKPVTEQPNYSISDEGRVRNEKTGYMMRPSANGRSGQLAVRLGSGTDARDYYIHRLVAEHFIPDFDPSLQYRHANNDVTDNRPHNLEPRQSSAAPRRGGRTHR
jgi:hypothetical protein